MFQKIQMYNIQVVKDTTVPVEKKPLVLVLPHLGTLTLTN